jgi:hypothetical protein
LPASRGPCPRRGPGCSPARLRRLPAPGGIGCAVSAAIAREEPCGSPGALSPIPPAHCLVALAANPRVVQGLGLIDRFLSQERLVRRLSSAGIMPAPAVPTTSVPRHPPGRGGLSQPQAGPFARLCSRSGSLHEAGLPFRDSRPAPISGSSRKPHPAVITGPSAVLTALQGEYCGLTRPRCPSLPEGRGLSAAVSTAACLAGTRDSAPAWCEPVTQTAPPPVLPHRVHGD